MDHYEDAPLISPQLQAYSIPRQGTAIGDKNGASGVADIDRKLMALAGGGAQAAGQKQHGGTAGYPQRSLSGGYSSQQPRGGNAQQYSDGGYSQPPPAGGYQTHHGGYSTRPPAGGYSSGAYSSQLAAGGYSSQSAPGGYSSQSVASGYSGQTAASGYAGQSAAGGYSTQSATNNGQAAGFRKQPNYGRPQQKPAAPKRRFDEDGVGNTDWANKFDGPLPEEILSQCRLFVCKLCQVELTSDIISTQHYSGKAHEKKVVAALEEYAKKTGQAVPKKKKVELAGTEDVEIDASRLAHWQASYQQMYDTPLPAPILAMCRPSNCQICRIQFSAPAVAKSHYEGKNHEKTMKPLLKEYCEKNNLPIPTRHGAEELQETRCELCSVDFTSVAMAKTHLNGRQHLKRLQTGIPKAAPEDPFGRFGIGISFRDNAAGAQPKTANQDAEVEAALKRARAESEDATDFGGAEDSTPSKKKLKVAGTFICEPCGISCNGPEGLDAHLKGVKHAKKTKQGATSASQLGNFSCKLCGVNAPTEDLLAIHLAGKQHKKKMALANNPSEFRCDLCNTIATSADVLAVHMAGKKHMKRLSTAGQPVASA